MAVRKLLFFPDPLLAHASTPIVEFDDHLRRLVDDLIDTLQVTPGVGLAAPQIGRLECVSVIDVRRKNKNKKKQEPASHGLIVLINPSIIKEDDVKIVREGCLSVPDLLANVKRFQNVTVRTRTLEGGETQLSAEGFEALALQHEIDHLKGTLFLDRVANIQTDIFRRMKT